MTRQPERTESRSATMADPVIACILSLNDVRDKRGGEFPPYLSTHVWAEFLTALKARGWVVAPEGVRLTPVKRDPVTLPPVDDFDVIDNRPIIGYCSQCGEAREDDYTCRDGGTTIAPGQVWNLPHGGGQVRIQGFSKTDRGWVKVRAVGGDRERWQIPPAPFRNGSMERVDAPA